MNAAAEPTDAASAVEFLEDKIIRRLEGLAP